ncbi:MAG: adenine deaminase [Nitrospinae bacterium RIFCSPLOWO2_12_39_16]|nr:MAG: adenine deaminase [Nitrospinae bacterium RIFCSPLOWO2_12_39_16]
MINLEKRIKAAMGEIYADLLIKNAQVINVFSGEIQKTDVAVFQGMIAGFGRYKAKKTIDIRGMYLSPGLIDGHVHIESSMVLPIEFATGVAPLGTTTVVIDPHEIANVFGLEGIKFMAEYSKNIPLDIFIMLPSCVPATDMETSGGRLGYHDLSTFADKPWVLGLAEMMNYSGVIHRDNSVLKKIDIMKGKVIDGHAPGLSGKGLNAYISAGIRSDHECTTIEEAREKLEKGMYIMLREGTIAKNLKTLLPFITTENSRRFMFVTDDRNPVDIVNEGHINFMVKTAIKWGIDPVTAVRMATLNPAEYFRLNKFGAIAPGYNADFIFFDNLKSFNIKKVFKRGRLVAENGCLIPEIPSENPIHLRCSMNVKPISIDNLKIKVRGRLIKVIEIISGQLITRKKIEKAKIDGEIVVADVDRDILKVAVIERHLSSGNIGIGFVEGFGLKKGAIASSVSHDSHNIITVGTSDRDMMCAVNEIIHLKGGQVVVSGEDIIESFPLPVAGLMSDKSLNEVKDGVERLNFAAKRLGCPLTNPFMSLSFLSLSVIPELKITDKGLIDVEKSKIVPLFER